MTKKRIFLIIISLVLVVLVGTLLRPQAPQRRSECEIFRENIDTLYPYLVESGWFYHPANAPTIQAKINAIEKALDGLPKQSHSKINLAVFKQQLKMAKNIFLDTPDVYSRDLLLSFVNKCDFCVSLLSEVKNLEEEEIAQMFSSTFNIAEFYYSLHSYDLALKYYNKFINEEVLMQHLDVAIAIEKQVMILISYQKNLPAAIDLIEKYARDPKLSNLEIIDFVAWQKGLGLALEMLQNTKTLTTFVAIEKFVTQMLTVPDLAVNKASYFVLLGFLHDYLSYAPAEIKPIVFYWLAVCDRMLGYKYLHKISNLYLKQCIYAGNIQSKYQCFAEYKNYLTTLYASPNTQLPYTTNNDLADLYQWIHAPENK